MNRSEGDVAANTRRLLVFQIIGGVVVALLFGIYQGSGPVPGVLWGTGISISSLLLLSHGVKRAEQTALENPKKSIGMLYLGAVQRFVLVVVLFIVGIMFLALDPVGMSVGFIAGQVANMFNLRGHSGN